MLRDTLHINTSQQARLSALHSDPPYPHLLWSSNFPAGGEGVGDGGGRVPISPIFYFSQKIVFNKNGSEGLLDENWKEKET